MAKQEGHAPLVASGHFEYNNRPPRDRAWAFVYLLLLGVAVVGGVYGYYHHNPVYEKTTHIGYLADEKHCPLSPSAHGTRRLLEAEEAQFDIGLFFKQALKWLVASGVLSLLFGYGYLHLFRKHAGVMVKLTAAVQVLLPLAAGVAGLLSPGGWAAGAPFLVVAGIAAFTMYLWSGFFGLCGRLLGVAAEGLTANPGLFVVVLLQQVAVLLLSLPLIGLMAVAWTNGEVVPNPARVSPDACYNAQGDEVLCCVWQPDAWVPPYLAAVGLALLWTTFLAFTLRMFVISGTIAQYYFAQPVGGSGVPNTPGATMRSVRHAFGPSFGSLCLGSGVLTWIDIMRNMANSAENSNDNLLSTCFRMIVECVISLIEYLTKFAIIRLAITGESFFRAGREATDLLRRNFLKSFGVWWFPPIVLNTTATIISLVWGGVVFGISYWFWQNQRQGLADAIILAVISAVVTLAVLSFFFGVLLNVVDVTYFCYALDLDASTVSRPEVHAVFSEVPVKAQGAAVQNPDGAYMYGQAQNQPMYVPPAQQQHATYPTVV